MQNNEFRKRMYGTVIVKSINSNFNADFTHAPRTLPDGTVYATDKALKYAIKDFIRKTYPGDKDKYILYMKRFNDDLAPLSLEEAYHRMMTDLYGFDSDRIEALGKKDVLAYLLNCFDIKFFGSTFAMKAKGKKSKKGKNSDETDAKGKNINLSIHGPLQINHGINKFSENIIYSEQILSPFRNAKEAKEGTEAEDGDNKASTLGSQTNLQEGHYVFHFSLNPFNPNDHYKLLAAPPADNSLFTDSTSLKEVNPITEGDVIVMKNAMNNAVTYLDSSRKIGSENELSIFITLKEESKKVIPSTTELIDIRKEKEKPGFIIVDAARLGETLSKITDDLETVEIYFNRSNTILVGLENAAVKYFDLISGKLLGD